MCNLFTSNQERGRGIQMKTHIYITPLALTPPGGKKLLPGDSRPFPHTQTWEWLSRSRDKEKKDSHVPSQAAGQGKAPVLGQPRS